VKRAAWLLALVFAVALGCGGDEAPAGPSGTDPRTGADGGPPGDGPGDDDDEDRPRDGTLPDGGRPPIDHPASVLRLIAANLTSGGAPKYDTGEGIRILQGLHPDIALVQEANYRTNTSADLATFVTTAFGSGFSLYREPDGDIPNAIVSRYPIAASGTWADPEVGNRGFAWAKITIPGEHPFWAVSVHLLTTGSTRRNLEAAELVARLGEVVSEGDYVVVGGDFNTESRSEPCLATLSPVVETGGPFPADQAGDDSTNRTRTKPFDWLLVSPALRERQVATAIGGGRFEAGLVFDSRVFTPLAEVPPILKTDSDAPDMQHMPVVKDFDLGTP
jgi:endonuclease/exonuclease/phosphatase family metal-dependent hydrolase